LENKPSVFEFEDELIKKDIQNPNLTYCNYICQHEMSIFFYFILACIGITVNFGLTIGTTHNIAYSFISFIIGIVIYLIFACLCTKPCIKLNDRSKRAVVTPFFNQLYNISNNQNISHQINIPISNFNNTVTPFPQNQNVDNQNYYLMQGDN